MMDNRTRPPAQVPGPQAQPRTNMMLIDVFLIIVLAGFSWFFIGEIVLAVYSGK